MACVGSMAGMRRKRGVRGMDVRRRRWRRVFHYYVFAGATQFGQTIFVAPTFPARAHMRNAAAQWPLARSTAALHGHHCRVVDGESLYRGFQRSSGGSQRWYFIVEGSSALPLRT